MASPEVDIPKTQRGIVYTSPGSVAAEVQELPVPEPGPNQVLVRLTHSGVCHSDLSVMTNGMALLPFPCQAGTVGGHEGVGHVVKLGPGAEVNRKIGDRVGIKWISFACGGCAACLEGHDAVCFNQQISGYMVPGTFQHFTVAPAHYVTPIPDKVDSAEAAPIMCGGVTAYSAIRKCGAIPGNSIVVMGAGGGLGHLAVQIGARGFGYRVIGVDHSSKKDFVISQGAEHFIAVDQTEDMVKAVQDLTGGLGAHAVLVLVGNNKAYETGMNMLRFGGRLLCIGIPEGKMEPIATAYPGVILAKELSILGVAVGDRRDAIEVLDLAARGIVKIHYRLEKMDKIGEVFKEMQAGTLNGRIVLDLA